MEKMAVVLLLLFAGAFLSFTQAQDDLVNLPDMHKKGVLLALEQLHAHANIQHHYRFLKSLEMSDIDIGHDVGYFYHHFHIKPTKCVKGKVENNAKTCAYRNDRPLIDCAVCYKTYAGEIETEPKPYINCVHKPAMTKDMQATREDHCNKMGYSSGAPTLLASKGN